MWWLKAGKVSPPTDVGGNERGASAVIVAMLLVVLLGFAALSIDVGAAYAEKAQLQSGADATALAIATDCANGVDCPKAMADNHNFLAAANANDGSSGLFSVSQPTPNSVRVETNAQEAGSTADSFTLFFARALGIDSTIIHSAAVASWGPPDGGSTLPWTVSECVFRQSLTPTQLKDLDDTGSFTGDPLKTRILVRYDQTGKGKTAPYPGCEDENGYAPGGFGWLEPNAECSADITADSTVQGQPGNAFPKVGGSSKVCEDILAGIRGKSVLIPLFSEAIDGGGDRTKYTLIGFAAFVVTGFKFSGSDKDTDAEAPECKGECRGLQGYFTRFVSLGEADIDESGGGTNYGASIVVLTG